jgi:probable phosphoglycerate mutase
MTTLLLIRHAETDAVGKSLSGWLPGWHLNEAGRAQADQLARSLQQRPLRAVYASPLERAFETALPIANSHGLVPVTVLELGEMRVGAWEGRSFDQLETEAEWRTFNTSREEARPPGGESMQEMKTRMLTQLSLITERHENSEVAIVSHADPLRAVIAQLLGKSLDYMLEFAIDPASVSVVQAEAGRWRVCNINQTGELCDELTRVA